MLAVGAVLAVPAVAVTFVVVDDDGFGTPGDCNTATPALLTIQDGVDAAASGDTVIVCPGTYVENVTVDKSIRILGARAGVDARTRVGVATESLVNPDDSLPLATFNLTADNVILDGFLLAGNEENPAIQTSPSDSGYRILNNRVTANAFGMYLNASGLLATAVQRNNITGNNQNLGVAAAAGNGIYSDAGLANAFIQSNRFRNNMNAAIVVAGVADGVTAAGNNSGADGTFLAAFAGTNFRMNNNVVTGSLGSGIYLQDVSAVTIARNTVIGSGFSGIRVADGVSAATVGGNTSNDNGDQGISVSSTVTGAANVRSNITNGNVGDGILFSAGTDGNLVRDNQAADNGNLDCEDLSTGAGTAGTANGWIDNAGVTQAPVGICSPPEAG